MKNSNIGCISSLPLDFVEHTDTYTVLYIGQLCTYLSI